MAGLEIITFGCRLNAYESEVIRARAREAGLAGAVIVNTCAVTAEAERQARQAIRKARRRHPDARIIVTGCSAQIDPTPYAAMTEVDQVLGNGEKLKAASYKTAARIAVADAEALRETAAHLLSGVGADGFAGRARAFVEVQQGCDHRCTFCIIPYGRGPSRSTPLGRVAAEVRSLVDAGVKEVALTGVDLTDYGKDLPGRPTLGQLVRRLLAAVPALGRLRLSSLDPVEIDEELYRLVAEEPRLMPHLHLSLQAGDDLVLKRMKRRHGRAQAIALCERLDRLRPGIALGADLIAGFPTETEAMFENSLSLVEACGLAFLHVFPYSPRTGTPAARMPQIPAAERKARAAHLRAAGSAALARFLSSQVGRTAQVLVEGPGRGRSEHFAAVRLEGPALPGSLVRARLLASDGAELLARVV
ncbi:MAG TPA: tRNA (N(6)-L-threonylcarbamoyladenosine(37)-C(2))-methylthiotransferase MtaB [Alphaproteobacteria bacterium]|nr:tRNA (N(6)-L-threonylcarbamoyladenosine(37)-C(2))-methylthiotransferase MtaB [Alphaproteobacteria bacterium]